MVERSGGVVEGVGADVRGVTGEEDGGQGVAEGEGVVTD